MSAVFCSAFFCNPTSSLLYDFSRRFLDQPFGDFLSWLPGCPRCLLGDFFGSLASGPLLNQQSLYFFNDGPFNLFCQALHFSSGCFLFLHSCFLLMMKTCANPMK